MRHLRLIAILPSLLLPALVHAAGAGDPQASALNWLQHLDNQRYTASYAQSSPLLRKTFTQEQWTEAIAELRGSLGLPTTRAVQGSQAVTTLPDFPVGSYIVIQFATTFPSGESLTETVTVAWDASDETWRVAAYFAR